MKIGCIYSSKTGNTQMVMEAVHEIMPQGTQLHAIESAPSAEEFDLIILGFWVDKGTADAKTLKYIETIKNKKVALLGTLGAFPDSDHGRGVIVNVTKELGDNEVVESFLCQGKIDPKLLEAMAKIPGHEMTEERRARIEEAKKHPNDEDLENARKTFAAAIAKLGAGNR